MSKNYKVYASIRQEVYVEKDSIIDVLKQERAKLLGGTDRYIIDGKVYKEDDRFNNSDYIRDATNYEIKMNEALRNVIEFLRENV